MNALGFSKQSAPLTLALLPPVGCCPLPGVCAFAITVGALPSTLRWMANSHRFARSSTPTPLFLNMLFYPNR